MCSLQNSSRCCCYSGASILINQNKKTKLLYKIIIYQTSILSLSETDDLSKLPSPWFHISITNWKEVCLVYLTFFFPRYKCYIHCKVCVCFPSPAPFTCSCKSFCLMCKLIAGIFQTCIFSSVHCREPSRHMK